MSDYYDLCLAVDLRPDLPAPVLDELRWHLGLVTVPTPTHTAADFVGWGGAWRVFEGGVGSHGFDGADVSLLLKARDRVDGEGNSPWALTVRVCVHEDDLGIMLDVVAWVLRNAVTRGFAGFLRHGASGTVQHILCHDDAFELVTVGAVKTGTLVAWG